MFFTPTAYYKPSGQTLFTFNADYMMLTYQFTDGVDLDTKTRIAIPDIGQDTTAEYMGYGSIMGQYPFPPILTFGGDNQGTGFESVLINIINFKTAYPASVSFTVDARALWFYNNPLKIGVQPITVAVTLWKGGTPTQDGYIWTNPTATNSTSLTSAGITITSIDQTRGQRAATISYNIITTEGVININDTTTPTV